MGILNDRIKQRRLQLGFTLLYVAEELGVKEATAQRYESGEIKNIKHETVAALAEILRCSPAYLMGWQDNLSSSLLSVPEDKLLNIFRSLNVDGQRKLIERGEELRELGYTKESAERMA